MSGSGTTGGVTDLTVTTYVEYLYPGTFFPEHSVREVASRDPELIASEAPEGVYAFTFFDRVSAVARIDGETVVLRSDRIHATGRYYVDAEKLTRAEVAALPGDHKILLANMRGNDWDPILRCRTGNWQPMEDGDVLVSSQQAGHGAP